MDTLPQSPASHGLRARRLLAVVALLALMLLASACSRPAVRLVDDGASYSVDEARSRAATMQAGAAASVRVEGAIDARRDALVALRRIGAVGNRAADVLTREFPVDTKAVPFYVEAATVEPREVWIVVEAWGGRTGKLEKRRLWILDRSTGSVVTVAPLR